MAQSAPTNSRNKSSKPLYTGDKETYVKGMFEDVASRYDLLNQVLSLSQHKSWRRLTVRLAGVKQGDFCLDVCTGTGDFAVDLAKTAGASGRVIGADFCEPMIRNGLSKVAQAEGAPITMMVANAEALPYPANSFDIVTVGFGIRNVANVAKAAHEMARVAKPGGKVAILEFSRPRAVWYKPFVDFYLFHILPKIGGLFSRQDAYSYLPQSMKEFVSREKLAEIMTEAGLKDIEIHDLNLGTVCIHIGTKSRPLELEAEAEKTP